LLWDDSDNFSLSSLFIGILLCSVHGRGTFASI
jgi:hypothetical protein